MFSNGENTNILQAFEILLLFVKNTTKYICMSVWQIYISFTRIYFIYILKTHRPSGDQMESSIVIKINFVDEFHFLCFEESIKVLCPSFVIFHFSKKERIELLEIKERIFNFLFWVQLSCLHFVAIPFARTLRWWLIWGLHNECIRVQIIEHSFHSVPSVWRLLSIEFAQYHIRYIIAVETIECLCHYMAIEYGPDTWTKWWNNKSHSGLSTAMAIDFYTMGG